MIIHLFFVRRIPGRITNMPSYETLLRKKGCRLFFWFTKSCITKYTPFRILTILTYLICVNTNISACVLPSDLVPCVAMVTTVAKTSKTSSVILLYSLHCPFFFYCTLLTPCPILYRFTLPSEYLHKLHYYY